MGGKLADARPHILVAGAGINGMLSAYYLQRAGMRVTICDAGPIPNPESASHGAHRLIHPWPATDFLLTKMPEALRLWGEILRDINCVGFVRTGVLVASPQRGKLVGKTHAIWLDNRHAEWLLAGAGQEAEALFFPDFGLLLAARILGALTQALRRNGVEMLDRSTIVDLDPATGRVDISNGESIHSDIVVLAAGWQARKLKHAENLSELLSQFSPRRSYVLYIAEKELPLRLRPKSSWADFRGRDLWGVPAVYSYDVKFGCGQLTHNAEQRAYSAEYVRDCFVYHYAEADAAYEVLRRGRISSNVWAFCPAGKMVRTIERCIVLTSDSGGGFKLAPVAGLEACAAVEKALRGGDRHRQIV